MFHYSWYFSDDDFPYSSRLAKTDDSNWTSNKLYTARELNSPSAFPLLSRDVLRMDYLLIRYLNIITFHTELMNEIIILHNRRSRSVSLRCIGKCCHIARRTQSDFPLSNVDVTFSPWNTVQGPIKFNIMFFSPGNEYIVGPSTAGVLRVRTFYIDCT